MAAGKYKTNEKLKEEKQKRVFVESEDKTEKNLNSN